MSGLMLTDDLIFFSRVEGVARARGLKVRQVRSTQQLLDAVRQNPPSGLILDLQNSGLDVNTLLAQLRELGPARPHVVGYGSHVEAQTLRAARTAGCDLVLPRSQFVERLEEDLEKWLSQTPIA